MTNAESFWNQKYSKESERRKPSNHSAFVESCLQYFPKQGRILELGTWGGEDALFLSRKGYSVVATDFSVQALAALQQKLTQDPQPDLTTAYLDLNNPFIYPDNSFDVVYSNLALHYFNRQITQQIFDEILRVLNPEGIVAVSLNSTTDSEYGMGKEIEKDYFEISPGESKRYFSVKTLKDFTGTFETIVLDNKGADPRRNHKTGLIRFIGRK